MKLTLLTESLAKLAPDLHEAFLLEMPHGVFIGTTPNQQLTALLHSGTQIDLGFEDLAIAQGSNFNVMARQLAHVGWRIPCLSIRIRSSRHGVFELEPIDGSEPILPDDWLEFIQVFDTKRPTNTDITIWYGSKVRAERRAPDPENFVDEIILGCRGFRRTAG